MNVLLADILDFIQVVFDKTKQTGDDIPITELVRMIQDRFSVAKPIAEHAVAYFLEQRSVRKRRF